MNIKKLLLFALFSLSLCAQGVPAIGIAATVGGSSSYALISHAAAAVSGGSSVTSPVNTGGANLILVEISSYYNPTLSDSTGNTWTLINSYNSSSSWAISSYLYECVNPTTSSGHTFTATGGNAGIFMEAFSGPTSTVDQQTSGYVQNNTTVATGSITPTQNSELVIALLATANQNGTAVAISSISGSFTATDLLPTTTSGGFGGGMAYLIQTTATAENPTWTVASGSGMAMVAPIVSFK